ncbi:MAG TPA: divalent-cation tolerance protein CutA [Sphingomicrobium sp.]|nr:divalent-cation tolerance protein CutA [Sphingomicrobium sp.]
MSVVTVYATFTYAGQAQTIASTVVEERLAACVNVLQPCRSVFRWEGEIQTATETPALFKTTLERADALIARIKELHSYDIPAIVVWPIERLSADFGDWVEENVR